MIIVLFLLFLVHAEAGEYYSYDVEPDTIYYTKDKSRIRGFSRRKDADFVVGAIFPVHNSEGGVCQGHEVFAETSDYVEAVLYSVDLINGANLVLPAGIKLGYDVRDSCITDNIALEETADMVLESDDAVCSLETAVNETDQQIVPVSAIVGDYASFISVPLASFLRLFSVPQISVATSVLLNNRERYGYFYRTVPSDDQQTQAIVDLALHFDWTYVSLLHSNDLYGEPGIDNFRTLAGENGICIDLDEGIDDDFTSAQYTALASRVLNSTAKVIIFFSSFNQVDGLLQYIQKVQSHSKQKKTFMWIAGDTWAESSIVLSKYEELVRGMWGVVPHTTTHPGFYKYLTMLNKSNNKRNKWYHEYHEYYYSNCSQQQLNVSCDDRSIGNNVQYRNNSFTPFVIDAVFSFAHALNDFLMENCDKPVQWNSTLRRCNGQTNDLNGTALRSYLKKVNFTSITGNKVVFDQTGSIEGEYFILNYQMDNSSEKYKIVQVAKWDGRRSTASERLQFKADVVHQFGVDGNGEPARFLESQCQRCQPGFIQHKVLGSCCGTCSPCLGQNYSNGTDSSQRCSTCPPLAWGNNPLNGSHFCMDIEEAYLDHTDVWGIILIVFCFFGMMSVLLVAIGMVAFWNKPIIKSSGREQMILLLIGIVWCFISTVLFILKPSIPVCLLQRLSTWMCFSLILAALLVKLVRIARIFLRTKSSRRPRCIQPVYQVAFTLLLVGFQLLLVIASLILVHPKPEHSIVSNTEDTNDRPTLVVRCSSPHIAMTVVQMLCYTIALVTSNALAMLTIRFPDNFNEVRYVAFSTFSVGIIWLTFIIAYFATEDEFQTAIISLAIQMSAFVVLMCMFVSRMIMLIFLRKQVEKQQAGMNTILSSLPPTSNFNGSRRTTITCESCAAKATEQVVQQQAIDSNNSQLPLEKSPPVVMFSCDS